MRQEHLDELAHGDLARWHREDANKTLSQRLEEAVALAACMLADQLRRRSARGELTDSAEEAPLPAGLRSRLP